MSQIPPSIDLITRLPADFTFLISNSALEGFTFLQRMESEWHEDKNRFSDDGEFLLAATLDECTIGVCGMNVDPYTVEQDIARLRHLYVLPEHRSAKVGSMMVRNCLKLLHPKFTAIRLQVPSPDTGRFYEKLGFKPVKNEKASHILLT